MQSKFFIFYVLNCFCFSSFAQSTISETEDIKTISFFEKFILKGSYPPDSLCKIQYTNDMRTIIWSDRLIKDYKYSNEVFDKLGYEFFRANAGDSYQKSKVYRNCEKGISVEVFEKYREKKLSIQMSWFEPKVRSSIIFLRFCPTK